MLVNHWHNKYCPAAVLRLLVKYWILVGTSTADTKHFHNGLPTCLYKCCSANVRITYEGHLQYDEMLSQH